MKCFCDSEKCAHFCTKNEIERKERFLLNLCGEHGDGLRRRLYNCSGKVLSIVPVLPEHLQNPRRCISHSALYN